MTTFNPIRLLYYVSVGAVSFVAWTLLCLFSSLVDGVDRAWRAMWDDTQRHRFRSGDRVTFWYDAWDSERLEFRSWPGAVVSGFIPSSAAGEDKILVFADHCEKETSGEPLSVDYYCVSHDPSRRVFRPWRWVKGLGR